MRPSLPVSLSPDLAMAAPILSASEIAKAVISVKLTAFQATEDALARIAQHDGILNSFTDVTGERARAKARAVDAAIAAGKNPGPLAGVPFAVKNLFDVKGLATRAGSKINRDLKPAARDATLIERLEAAGAVLVGALNMGEYAYDFTGENVHDGNAHNPHDVNRMTGGSSSGSGGAVAGGLVPLSLGSDTNGSIRVPSSFCGLFGLKPTYGRLSRARSFPFVSSLDHLGPIAAVAVDEEDDGAVRRHRGDPGHHCAAIAPSRLDHDPRAGGSRALDRAILGPTVDDNDLAHALPQHCGHARADCLLLVQAGNHRADVPSRRRRVCALVQLQFHFRATRSAVPSHEDVAIASSATSDRLGSHALQQQAAVP